ncbi:putative Pyrophosphatase PpaX [Blattamonas nauphoetae]|uniref:Pyrophosphatase PpaX n=1 Tax=Blattamonas nauphoetae TaxID=2049346 RepID=A0ABQ9YLU4_9EUKA|nr:putative Pyrophosphatase PpaX [Blattamonas nauphoetae]
MPMIDAVIFDNDGTLTDSRGLILNSRQLLLREYGIEKTIEVLDKEHQSLELYEELCINFERRLTQSEFETMAEKYRAIQSTILADSVKLFPNVLEVLEQLKKMNVKIALATNRPRKSLETMMEVAGLNGIFDVVISRNEITKPKPDPEMIHVSMKLLGCTNKDRIIYCGDSETDMAAGASAGVKTAIVPYKPGPTETPPTYDLKQLSDLIQICTDGTYH